MKRSDLIEGWFEQVWKLSDEEYAEQYFEKYIDFVKNYDNRRKVQDN